MFAAHASSTEKVFDNENGEFLIHGDHERTLHSGFGVDEMVTALPVKGEAGLFEVPPNRAADQAPMPGDIDT